MAGRLTQQIIEALINTTPNARITQIDVEVLRNASTDIVARVSQIHVDVLRNATANARVSAIHVEVLRTSKNTFDDNLNFTSTAGYTTALPENTFDDDLSLSSTNTLTFDPATSVYYVSVSFSSTNTLTFSPNNVIEVSISFSSTSTYNNTGGFDFNDDLNLSSTSDITFVLEFFIAASVTFSSVADITFDALTDFNPTLIFTGTNTLTFTVEATDEASISFSSTNTFNLVDGLSFEESITLDGFAVIDFASDLFIPKDITLSSTATYATACDDADFICFLFGTGTNTLTFNTANDYETSINFTRPAGFVINTEYFEDITFAQVQLMFFNSTLTINIVFSPENSSTFSTNCVATFEPFSNLFGTNTLTFAVQVSDQVSITLSSTNNFSLVAGAGLFDSITFSLTANATFTYIIDINPTITFSSTVGFSTDVLVDFNLVLSLTSTNELTFDPATSTYSVSLIFNGTNGFNLTLGSLSNDFIQYDAMSDCTFEQDLTFDDTLTFSSTANITFFEEQFFNYSVSFNGVNVFSLGGTTLDANPVLTGADPSEVEFEGGLDFDESISFSETGGITFLDGLGYFDNITLSASNGFSVVISSIDFGVTLTFNGTNTFAIDSDVNVYHRSTSNTITFNQLTTEKAVWARTITQTFVIGQIALQGHIHNLTTSNTLVFTHQAIRVHVESAENTFVINQFLTISGRIRRQSASNLLVFNQNTNRILNAVRSASNQLIFNAGFRKYSQIGDIFVQLPSADFIVVPKECFTILESSSRSIVLPCPRFDDTQEWSSLNINLKRSILGDTRTYVRRGGLTKLKYSFWLGRLKSLELRQFILDFIDENITMTNFKGEVWFGHILNNPLDLMPKQRYEPERERVEVTLEFEGIKLRG